MPDKYLVPGTVFVVVVVVIVKYATATAATFSKAASQSAIYSSSLCLWCLSHFCWMQSLRHSAVLVVLVVRLMRLEL